MNRIVRWGGAVACAVVMGVYIGQCWATAIWEPSPPVSLACGGGAIHFSRSHRPQSEWFLERWRAQGGYPYFEWTGAEFGDWLWLPSLSSIDVGAIRVRDFVVIPLWLPLALAAVPTALAWRSERRRRRIGLCPKCRYDLTGLPAAAPCPECGRARPAPPLSSPGPEVR